MRSSLSVAMVIVLATAQCGSPKPGRTVGADAGTDAGVTSDATSVADASAVPDSAAGAQLQWLLELLNGPAAAVTATNITPHFTAAVLDELPAAALASMLTTIIASDGPVTLRQIESSSPGSAGAIPVAAVVAIVETARHLFVRITLTARALPGGEIGGLTFAPAPEYDDIARDPVALLRRLPAVAPHARLLIADLDAEGTCTPSSALGADDAMPIGSMFKLYVLGAVASRIQQGVAAWQDLVTIDDALKSLPSGDLQDQLPGATFSVEAVAGKMIAISDNTAADHLIHLLGRQAVESVQVAMGHSHPTLNAPFLTTRELFQLKLGASVAERAAYVAASPDERRRLLADDIDHRPLPPLMTAAAWSNPIDIDQLEWFATPADLCRAFGALRAMGELPSTRPVMNILALNPGLPVDARTFSYVGFKGGSEPGVLAAGWLLRRAVDGRWVVVILGFADSAAPIDEFAVLYHALAAVQLAGR